MPALAKDHYQRPSRSVWSSWNIQTHPHYTPLIPNNELNLVCRGKQPCLKMTSNWQTKWRIRKDLTVSQRKDMSSSHENSTGKKPFKNSVGRESAGSPCAVGRESVGSPCAVELSSFVRSCISVQVSRGSWSQKIRSQRVQQITRVSLRSSRTIQGEPKRNQIESVSLKRSLKQNCWVRPASQSSERARKSKLTQQ